MLDQTIYLIDDEPTIRDAISQALLIEQIHVVTFPNALEAFSTIDMTTPAIVITDIHMPVMTGLDFMTQLLGNNPHFQVIVLTGYGDVSTAVTAMKSGACDFLEKPFSTEKLLASIYKAQEKLTLVRENIWLKKELEMQSQVGPKLIGHSKAIVDLRRKLIELEPRLPIIFVGKVGTGKRIAAQYTHDIHSSPQAELYPLSAYTLCELQECELIDSVSKLADHYQGGTIYIHSAEILTLAHWQQLLTINMNNCRLILATNTLPQEIESSQNQPTSLLYHFSLPELKDRREDIGLLFKHFVRGAASRYQLQPPTIKNYEIQQLESYEWPENIKQLRHYAEMRALKPAEESPEVLLSELTTESDSFSKKTERFEHSLLMDALQRHNGRLKEIQQELQISRKTLYDKLKKHQLDKSHFKT
ncbi:sigma-54-dependent transcriptional regulator [Vibrio genomosp. F6]|uniref:Two-component system response regulator n=1 Tax=Vibrio genomosp. F6 str. FF-238 TaxID=1191298 RepID=A0A1E5CVL5_9VIBR|nr:response regulator [Vibrio genomosp. F6]OEE73997.1 two-component system response regulator [Vibrio genomosp. F6 str. FF-238]